MKEAEFETDLSGWGVQRIISDTLKTIKLFTDINTDDFEILGVASTVEPTDCVVLKDKETRDFYALVRSDYPVTPWYEYERYGLNIDDIFKVDDKAWLQVKETNYGYAMYCSFVKIKPLDI